MTARRDPGRPVATTHDEIERVAFELFLERGFDAVTVEEIAEAAGISRRTLFRYFPSKNDIAWGQFDDALVGFATLLEQASGSVFASVCEAVVAFNVFPDDVAAAHRLRMRLILRTPALQAHSLLRYAAWRAVVAQYVARRLGQGADAALPTLCGHAFLAAATAAYEQWLEAPGADLEDCMRASLAGLGRLADL